MIKGTGNNKDREKKKKTKKINPGLGKKQTFMTAVILRKLPAFVN
jgi:hypothetical protein